MFPNRHGCGLKLQRGATSDEVSIMRSALRTRQDLPAVKDGTTLAVSYLRLGVHARSAHHTSRGGRRHRADPESYALSSKQVGGLIAAARHANSIDLPLTRMITIHWKAVGLPLTGMANASSHFLDLLTKALARHGSRTAWLSVH